MKQIKPNKDAAASQAEDAYPIKQSARLAERTLFANLLRAKSYPIVTDPPPTSD